MKLTLIQTGAVPEPLNARFDPYPDMFAQMFEAVGAGFTFETVRVAEGENLPDPRGLEAALITGSPAGVYDDFPWIAPLRAFIRAGYGAGLPMVGVCFGHQIIADALGGEVRKSEKGWGLGRHRYRVLARPEAMADAPETLAVACSHQDQVIVPPETARVVLASDFAPNAGLVYDNGAVLSVQPHPEFSDDYAEALARLRRGRAADAVVDAAIASFEGPSDRWLLADYLARFLAGAHAARAR